MVAFLGNRIVRHRAGMLFLLSVVSVCMGYYASQLRMDAGFAKQLPR